MNHQHQEKQKKGGKKTIKSNRSRSRANKNLGEDILGRGGDKKSKSPNY